MSVGSSRPRYSFARSEASVRDRSQEPVRERFPCTLYPHRRSLETAPCRASTRAVESSPTTSVIRVPGACRIEGEVEIFYLPFKLQANNGEALAEAAARDLGITRVPDFVAEDYLRDRGMVTLLEDFTPPDLGIYALLPSNRYLPHRVRALIEFLARRMKCPG